jgi:DNA-binding NarL/FixJ family response regulator
MLVDTHALIRQGFRHLLEAEADIAVVADAADAAEASRTAASIDTDVIVVGMTLPIHQGAAAVRDIVGATPGARVLFLSQSVEPHAVKRAFDAGANGCVSMRHAQDGDLAHAVRTVAAGSPYVSPELSGALIRALQAGSLAAVDPAERLTARERQVLRLIARGRSAPEIARELGLSANTVAVHRARAMNRLGVRNTASLVMYAVKSGLV